MSDGDPKPEGESIDLRLKGLEGKLTEKIDELVKKLPVYKKETKPADDPEKEALAKELAELKKAHRQELLSRLPKKLQEKYAESSTDVLKALADEKASGDAVPYPSPQEILESNRQKRLQSETGTYDARKKQWV